jgi:ribosomal RNA-processing protein 36
MRQHDGSLNASQKRMRPIAAENGNHQRASKHQPMETSSKRKVPVLRDVLQVGKTEFHDPRFESLAGKFVEGRFKKQYAFLYNETLPKERKALQQSLKKVKGEERKAELEAELTRVTQQLRNEEQRQKKEAREQSVKAKEREAVKDGKRPFFLKKSDKKKLELLDRYKELKDSGKLEAYMAKRRKKNAAKDHRYVPYRRNAGDADN